MRHCSRHEISATIVGIAAIVAVTACTVDSTGPGRLTPTAHPSWAASGGSSTYSIGLQGDLNSLSTSSGGTVLVKMSSSSPFQNLTLKSVRLTIGNGTSGPSGDVAACQAKASALPYATDWGGNDGSWTGTLTIDGTSYVKFSGSRTNALGMAEQIQFTVNYGTSVATDPTTGVATLTYDNAPLFFGSASTHFDPSHYRCVSFTATGTP